MEMKKKDLARCVTYYLLDNSLFQEIASDKNYENLLDDGIENMVKKVEFLLYNCSKEELLKIYLKYKQLL